MNRTTKIVGLTVGGLVLALLVIIVGGALFLVYGIGNSERFVVTVQARPSDDPYGTSTVNVRVLVDGEAVTSGPRGFESTDFFRKELSIDPGQRIEVEATSQGDKITCKIFQENSFGTFDDADEEREPVSRDPDSGLWRGGCSWTRPASDR